MQSCSEELGFESRSQIYVCTFVLMANGTELNVEYVENAVNAVPPLLSTLIYSPSRNEHHHSAAFHQVDLVAA